MLIFASDPFAEPMSLRFAYFLYYDLLEIKIDGPLDRAERYMSETVINTINPTWVISIHSFLVLYNNCRRPLQSLGVSSRIKILINNIQGLNLDFALDPNYDVNEEKPITKG